MLNLQQLEELAISNGYPLEEIKKVHDSLPPERQEASYILETYRLSLHETSSTMQLLNNKDDK